VDERQERLQMLTLENKRRQMRPQRLAAAATASGSDPTLDDILSLPAASELLNAVRDQAKYHDVWHRIWGDRLAGEVSRTLSELADQLDGETVAYMLWDQPPEAIRVNVVPVLRDTGANLSKQTYLTLVGDEGRSGLVLGWDHLENSNEYSLNTWGMFAVELAR
jgi:hypothetical protein